MLAVISTYCRSYKTLRNIDTHKLGSAKEVIIIIEIIATFIPLPSFTFFSIFIPSVIGNNYYLF